MNPSRRRVIFAGVFGAAALVAARWLPQAPAARDAASFHALDADGRMIVTALVPAMLAGALPEAPDARAEAIRDTVVGVERAIAGLPPLAQRELGQLFSLLALAPARWALLRSASSWPQSSIADVQAFLDRSRDSRVTLFRAAYDAFHQLIFAAWYGSPRAWAAIGYAGPPQV
jgi:hypothetical protein